MLQRYNFYQNAPNNYPIFFYVSAPFGDAICIETGSVLYRNERRFLLKRDAFCIETECVLGQNAKRFGAKRRAIWGKMQSDLGQNGGGLYLFAYSHEADEATELLRLGLLFLDVLLGGIAIGGVGSADIEGYPQPCANVGCSLRLALLIDIGQ